MEKVEKVTKNIKNSSKRELYNIDHKGMKIYVRSTDKGVKQKANRIKCENCGISVFTASKKAKYCSDSCRIVAYKKRKLQEEKEEFVNVLRKKKTIPQRYLDKMELRKKLNALKNK